MKNLLSSFGFAFSGIQYAIAHERNFRIHIVVIFYVLMISFFARLDHIEHIVIIFCFAGVISMELLNTAFELLCDKDGSAYNIFIKYGKDVSASAVLIYALASIVIGLIIYIPKIQMILNNITGPMIIFLILSIPINVKFIFKGENK